MSLLAASSAEFSEPKNYKSRIRFCGGADVANSSGDVKMPKILLAEDDHDFADLIGDWLEKDKYTVEITHDGDDAVQLLSSFHFDAAILDWELPGVSGIEICRMLRSKRSRIPIMLLTGRVKVEDTELGIDSGADDYLTKPIDPRVVLAKLKALFRRAESRVDSKLTLRHVEMDVDARVVIAHGQPAKLNPREFALLEVFLRHPDHVFSVDELLSAVWTGDEDVTEDSLRTSIFRLRKKIDQEGVPSLIDSIYGVGYIARSTPEQ
jgi:DNA-binding response OmpR family regulator